MSLIKDYDNFFLAAHDLDKAKEFFRDILELNIKFDFSDRGMVAFHVGESEPAIILRKADDVRPAHTFYG